MKAKLLIGSLVAASLIISSLYAVNTEVDETQLGLRKVDIYTEDTALDCRVPWAGVSRHATSFSDKITCVGSEYEH